MADQGYGNPQNEQLAAKNKKLSFKVFLQGNTSAGSIVGYTDANAGCQVWLAANSLTAPSDATFTGLQTTTAPATIGIYIQDAASLTSGGQAAVWKGAAVRAETIKSVSMTAGVITPMGQNHAISGKTGITSNGNVAFTIQCTTLDLDAQTANHEFVVDVQYDVL